MDEESPCRLDVVTAGEYQCPDLLADWKVPCYEACLLPTSCAELQQATCPADPVSTTWDPVTKCWLECQGVELMTCPTGEDSARCNDITSCPDGSDEADCPEALCDDGTVIPAHRVCNGPWNCPFGEDEEDCGELFMTCGMLRNIEAASATATGIATTAKTKWTACPA